MYEHSILLPALFFHLERLTRNNQYQVYCRAFKYQWLEAMYRKNENVTYTNEPRTYVSSTWNAFENTHWRNWTYLTPRGLIRATQMFQCQLLNVCQCDLFVQTEKGTFLWCVYMRVYVCMHACWMLHICAWWTSTTFVLQHFRQSILLGFEIVVHVCTYMLTCHYVLSFT